MMIGLGKRFLMFSNQTDTSYDILLAYDQEQEFYKEHMGLDSANKLENGMHINKDDGQNNYPIPNNDMDSDYLTFCESRI